MTEHTHAGMPLLRAGAGLANARMAVLLFHGRGAGAADILSLARYLPDTGVAYLAPQARNSTWYPLSFLSPIESNEPQLSSALEIAKETLDLAISEGIDPSRVVLAGFSQGACLAQEFAVRNPKRYGAVVGLSGGLIGPPGSTWSVAGRFEGMPVFLGCSDVDPHIPRDRVAESAAVFQEMGANVVERIYPGMAHTVNEEEIGAFRQIIEATLARVSN